LGRNYLLFTQMAFAGRIPRRVCGFLPLRAVHVAAESQESEIRHVTDDGL